MKYLLASLFLVTQLFSEASIQPDIEVQGPITFPRIPQDAIKAGIQAKLAAATTQKEITKYQNELAIINEKIEKFRLGWTLHVNEQRKLRSKR